MPLRTTRTSLAILSLFAFCLSATILGTASHVLVSYRRQHETNMWWLPIWPSHFDTRGLETLIGASVSLIVLDLAIFISAFLKNTFVLNIVTIFLTGLGLVAGVVEVAYPAVINGAAPGTDSMQTWTCQWASTSDSPANFASLCHESRFAYFATIPVFVTQLLMLGLAVQHVFTGRVQSKMRKEKGEELDFITAPESLRDGAGSRESFSGKSCPETYVYSSP